MPRTAIISDIHANLHALCAVIEDVQACQCADVVCLGDVVGYNAYPHECLDYIRSLGCPVVKGNHDAEAVSDGRVAMNPLARAAAEWTRAQLSAEELQWLARLPYQRIVRSSFTMVHASLEQPMAWNYIFNANDASSSFTRQFSPLCFHGHTHVPKVFYRDGAHVQDMGAELSAPLAQEGMAEVALQEGYKYFINVGSVGQPRDGDPRACYAIYDSDARCVHFRRVPYDIAAASEAVLAAGLPDRLAQRLLTGV